MPSENLQELIRQLELESNRFVIPQGYSGRSTTNFITDFSEKYLQAVSLESHTDIVNVLAWAKAREVSSPTLLNIFRDRITKAAAEQSLPRFNMVVREVLSKNDDHAVRLLVGAWLDSFDRAPKPSDTLLDSITRLKEWECTTSDSELCYNCARVRKFLIRDGNLEDSLPYLKARELKHIRKAVKDNAGGLAVCEAEETSYLDRGTHTLKVSFSRSHTANLRSENLYNVFVDCEVEAVACIGALRNRVT